MPELYLTDSHRHVAGPDHRLQAVRRALTQLELPVEDGAFDDLMFALAQIDLAGRASFDPPARAAA